jgi:ribosome-associated protein
MQAEQLVEIVQNELEERKGQFIKVLNVIGKTSITDYMVIVTATSERHAKALCDYVLERVKNQDLNPLGVEGGNTEWVLVDLGDVILHIMTAQAREFYQLEKLWSFDQSAVEEKAS